MQNKPTNGEDLHQEEFIEQIPDPDDADVASPGFGPDDDLSPSANRPSRLRAVALDVSLFAFIVLGSISIVLLLIRPFDFYGRIPWNEAITTIVLLLSAIAGVTMIATILAILVVAIVRSWFRHS